MILKKIKTVIYTHYKNNGTCYYTVVVTVQEGEGFFRRKRYDCEVVVMYDDNPKDPKSYFGLNQTNPFRSKAFQFETASEAVVAMTEALDRYEKKQKQIHDNLVYAVVPTQIFP